MKYFLLFLIVIASVGLTGCVGEPADLSDDYAGSHGQEADTQ